MAFGCCPATGGFELSSCTWLLPVLASATWVPLTIAVSDESICTGLCVVVGALPVAPAAVAVVVGAALVVDGADSVADPVDADWVVGTGAGPGSVTAVDTELGSLVSGAVPAVDGGPGSVSPGDGAGTSSTTTVTVGAWAVVVAVSGAGSSSA
jgi:hypothetical protein